VANLFEVKNGKVTGLTLYLNLHARSPISDSPSRARGARTARARTTLPLRQPRRRARLVSRRTARWALPPSAPCPLMTAPA